MCIRDRLHEVPKDWIICGNGAADLVFGLAHGCMPRRGLVTAPAFSAYEQAMRTCGCSVDYLFLEEKEGFSLNVEALLQRIIGAAGEGRPYDMVFLCNPNNPTGIPLSLIHIWFRQSLPGKWCWRPWGSALPSGQECVWERGRVRQRFSPFLTWRQPCTIR